MTVEGARTGLLKKPQSADCQSAITADQNLSALRRFALVLLIWL